MTAFTHDQLIFIARQHLQAGQSQPAADLLRQVLQSEPTRADALHLLGVAVGRAGQHDQAVAYFQRAIAVDPNFADAHADLGHQHRSAGRFDEAMAAYREASRLNPLRVEVRAAIGDLLRHRGEHRAAIIEYETILTIDPDLAEVHNNRGMSLAADRRVDDAIAAYQRAVALKPELVNAHYNLANAYRSQEKLTDAIAAYRLAIGLRPDFAEAYNNLGDALEASGDVAGAIAAYDESIRLIPDKPEPRWNRSLALLMSGDYEHGWLEYEWRHRRATAVTRPLGPRWNGEALQGKTILLHAEQGLGDTLQFVRFVPMVVARGGRVVLECQPSLIRLLQIQPGVAEIVPAGQPLPRYDVHCPLMSLGWVLGIRLDFIPAEAPYLRPSTDLILKWRDIVGPSTDRRRIGLVWAGNADHQYDRNRSMRLRDLRPLLGSVRADWFSLQVGPESAQVAALPDDLFMHDHTPLLADFADTAALVANLDAVVSVDTAVAHLSAAMGKPTWVLLAFAPDWRWMRDRSDSAWYPAARLFRQPAAGGWESVVRNVAAAINAESNHL